MDWAAIGAALLKILLGLFAGGRKASGPSAEERAGRAEQAQADQTEILHDIQIATDAKADAAAAVLRDPDSVRAPDPYSRD